MGSSGANVTVRSPGNVSKGQSCLRCGNITVLLSEITAPEAISNTKVLLRHSKDPKVCSGEVQERFGKTPDPRREARVQGNSTTSRARQYIPSERHFRKY